MNVRRFWLLLLFATACSSASVPPEVTAPASQDAYVRCGSGRMLVPTEPGYPSIAVVAHGERVAFSSAVLNPALPDFAGGAPLAKPAQVCVKIVGAGATIADLVKQLKNVVAVSPNLPESVAGTVLVPGEWQVRLPGAFLLRTPNDIEFTLRIDPESQSLTVSLGST
jgi:hypothetical protein